MKRFYRKVCGFHRQSADWGLELRTHHGIAATALPRQSLPKGVSLAHIRLPPMSA